MITRKKLMMIFSIFLTIIMVSRVFAADVISYKPKYAKTTENVKLRYTADLNVNNVLETIPKNTNLKIIGELSNFYVVQLKNNKVGFVSKDYLSEIDETTIGSPFYNLTKEKYETNANVRVRSGPSTSFKKLALLKEGEIVTVFGRINNFYTVIWNDNNVGLIESSFLYKSYADVDYNPNNLSKQDLVIYYINEERQKNGLSPLQDTQDLNRVATLKAQDMVKNNYFLHTSPSYGTPFNMLKNYGITYKFAGENIAGNTSMKSAVDKWMASETHKKNILSKEFKNIGVGVEKSKKYGYIIVVMFTD